MPAMVAIPVAISTKSSERESRWRYARTKSGASTMPMKMLAALASPTAPPSRKLRSRTNPKPRTMSGRIRQ